MPRGQQNGQATTSASESRRQRDYASLLDNEQLRRDGLQLRLDRMETELLRLLGNHQNAAQIMQVLTRPGDGYAAMVGRATIMDAKIAQYTAGLTEQRAESQTVSEVPVNPDDASKDVAAETNPEHQNGKVAVPA